MLTLTIKEQLTVPLEAEVLSPDRVASLSLAEIAGLPVHLGKKHCRVDDFFTITGEPCEHLVLQGDLSRVKWLGKAMSKGVLEVQGNAGMHLGSGMQGGTIRVSGSASDWVGAEMTGGCIQIQGNVGGQTGAAYRGSLTGMSGGTIVVGGSAGVEVGMRMKRGVLAIQGKVRDFAGLQMKGGTIILGSGAEIRTGAWMTRGTIVSLQTLPILPTFVRACTYNPSFLTMYAKHLQPLGFALPCHPLQGQFTRYSGDHAVPGKGELLIWEAGNKSA